MRIGGILLGACLLLTGCGLGEVTTYSNPQPERFFRDMSVFAENTEGVPPSAEDQLKLAHRVCDAYARPDYKDRVAKIAAERPAYPYIIGSAVQFICPAQVDKMRGADKN